MVLVVVFCAGVVELSVVTVDWELTIVVASVVTAVVALEATKVLRLVLLLLTFPMLGNSFLPLPVPPAVPEDWAASATRRMKQEDE